VSRGSGLSERARSGLIQAGSLLLAAALLWLALQGTDLSEIAAALRAADWMWLPVLAGLLLASHALRAWRWMLLVDGLPRRQGARQARAGETFAALMIGYMVNYAAPRLGEITRTATLSKRTGHPFSALFGTVVLERLLDVVMLGLGLLTVPFLLGDRLGALRTSILDPAADRLSSLPFGLLLMAGLLLLGIVGLSAWLIRRSAAREDGFVARRGVPLLRSFREGIATLVTAPKRGTLIGLTVVIWGLYGLLGFLPFVMLQSAGDTLAHAYGLDLIDGWCVMLIGGLGLVVPTPGGIGSYHYVTILTLTALYGLSEQAASTYAVLSHGSQLVLYVLVGALCVVALGRTAVTAQAGDASAPT
jgi:uncharacterized membrane protein YbhN (UPF0104 family)